MANDNYSAAQLFLKTILLTFFFLGLFFLLTLASIGVFAYKQLSIFTSVAGTSPAELSTILRSGWQHRPIQTNGHKNVLILGLDTLEGRADSQPLTDTMIIASLDLKSGTVRTVSLPRDLWSDEFKTKINALYFYGQDRNPSKPEQFPTEVIQNLTHVPIHHTVVLSLDQVAHLIDLMGGIMIDVPQSFTDTQFPRPDVDVTTERDPAKLYQTISFEKGVEQMTGERALQFIRSRHSEGEEGSDIARSNRQQLVIQSLIRTMMDRQLLTNPEKLGRLYRYYQENFASAISLEELVATTKQLLPYRNQIVLEAQSLGYLSDNPNGVLFHPPLSQTQNQWAYIILDLESFRNEMRTKLNLRDSN